MKPRLDRDPKESSRSCAVVISRSTLLYSLRNGPQHGVLHGECVGCGNGQRAKSTGKNQTKKLSHEKT